MSTPHPSVESSIQSFQVVWTDSVRDVLGVVSVGHRRAGRRLPGHRQQLRHVEQVRTPPKQLFEHRKRPTVAVSVSILGQSGTSTLPPPSVKVQPVRRKVKLGNLGSAAAVILGNLASAVAVILGNLEDCPVESGISE